MNKTMREKEFKKDLNIFLKKHNAEIETEYIYGGIYGIVVSMKAEYDKEGNETKEYTEINFGRYLE